MLMEPYTMAERRFPLLIEPAELASQLSTENLRIVFVDEAAIYEQAHIPGSVRMDYADLNTQRPPAGGLLPDMSRLARVLGAAGITPQTHVIALDASGNARAARLLWTLECLGHPSYSLLNGGLPAWLSEARTTAQGPAPAVENPQLYPAVLAHPQARAERDGILKGLESASMAIVDARSPAEYRGEDVRAARGGHIPGAVNIEWTDNIDPDNAYRLRPKAELEAMYQGAGLAKDQQVITHCQTHHRSSLSFFVLRYLGYTYAQAYDGSWSEWGNDPEVPIAKGDQPD